MTTLTDLKWDDNGLIPAVVQDDRTQQVLMLAWMNEEALRQTMTTGYVHFWSRSRQELWRKGATSGNLLGMSEIRYDCDGGALLVRATSHGPPCHTDRSRRGDRFRGVLDLFGDADRSRSATGALPAFI